MPAQSKKSQGKILLDVVGADRSLTVTNRTTKERILFISGVSAFPGCCSVKVLSGIVVGTGVEGWKKISHAEVRAALASQRTKDWVKKVYDSTVHHAVMTVTDNQGGKVFLEACKSLETWQVYREFRSRHGDYSVYMIGIEW